MTDKTDTPQDNTATLTGEEVIELHQSHKGLIAILAESIDIVFFLTTKPYRGDKAEIPLTDTRFMEAQSRYNLKNRIKDRVSKKLLKVKSPMFHCGYTVDVTEDKVIFKQLEVKK